MRNLFTLSLLLLSLPLTVSAQPTAIDPQVLQQMQETIRQQQQQLQQQAEQIKAQSEILHRLQQQISTLQQVPLPPTQTTATQTVQTVPALPVVTSGNDKIKLAISGQINRAVVVANDGYNSTLYHVDNTASNSRIRFVGTAKANDDLSLGTRIEVAISPDRSSAVSQQQKALTDTYFDQRWVEISLTSKSFGKLSIGKGDTASNTTAEVDLSKTDVVQYASITDMGGGFLFRSKNGTKSFIETKDASGKTVYLKVSDAFKSFDGLSRESRLRYDSPSLYGFSLAGSLVSNQRSDLALLWGGEGYGFKGAGAFAISNTKGSATYTTRPDSKDAKLLYDGSFSVLHTVTGLNLTLSGALQQYSSRKDATNLYAKLGWLANFTSQGYTAFGVDYTRSDHLDQAGDTGYSVGAAVVQAFEKFATELYFQYRIFSLDRAAGSTPVADINIGTFGARVKF